MKKPEVENLFKGKAQQDFLDVAIGGRKLETLPAMVLKRQCSKISQMFSSLLPRAGNPLHLQRLAKINPLY